MAMSMKQNFGGKLRRLPIGSVFLQEFTEQDGLTLQPLCSRIGGKEVAKFVAKDGCATWLQHDHRKSGINCTAQRNEDTLQILFGTIQHAKVVERASAAEMLDRKSTRLNSSHLGISYAVFCLKK